MRILLVSPSFYPATYYGGPIYSTYNTVKVLAKEGIKVFVSTTNANGRRKLEVPVNKFIEKERNLFIKYYGLSDSRGFSPFMYMLLWNDIRKADLVYLVSVFSPTTPLTLILSALFDKKIILIAHGQLGEWCLKQGNKLKKLWLNIFIKPFLKRITWEATSETEKEMIHKVFPHSEIFVIPGAVDFSEFQKLSEAKDYTVYKKLAGKELSGSKIIVSLGRLHKVKGFDILITAFNIVKDKFPNTCLLIAGEDFGERKNLEHLIALLNLNERIFLTGSIEGKDKTDFLLNADLFALASHHENFGVVYAEAMAAGLPVIASKNTPWQDVEKFNCGKWVENTPEAFASAMEEILNSDYVKIGEQGREYVSQKFDSRSVAEKYLNLFNSLVKNANA